jgi:hypothetical protein
MSASTDLCPIVRLDCSCLSDFSLLINYDIFAFDIVCLWKPPLPPSTTTVLSYRSV